MENEKRVSEVRDLLERLNKLESDLRELTSESSAIARGMHNYGSGLRREGHLMEDYFVNRLKNFVEDQEPFRFYSAREELEEELKDIEAGVYD